MLEKLPVDPHDPLGSDDLYVTVRNIRVSKKDIETAEQMIGGKLVPDQELQLIVDLDRIYELTVMKGQAVIALEHPGYPSERFVPAKLAVQIPILGSTINARNDRPAWFRIPKRFTGRTHQ